MEYYLAIKRKRRVWIYGYGFIWAHLTESGETSLLKVCYWGFRAQWRRSVLHNMKISMKSLDFPGSEKRGAATPCECFQCVLLLLCIWAALKCSFVHPVLKIYQSVEPGSCQIWTFCLRHILHHQIGKTSRRFQEMSRIMASFILGSRRQLALLSPPTSNTVWWMW